MRYEYPDYYNTFHCIGGSCKDSCCAGWEVDIDDDTARMYQNVPLPIGDRLREKLKLVDGGYRFELCPDKRCPFLNKDNLCDIIIAMGEGGLSVTCAEYPRYTCETPEYQLTDLTLSCPEASRIFFATEEPIRYEIRSEEYHDTDWEEDPFFDDAEGDDDTEEPETEALKESRTLSPESSREGDAASTEDAELLREMLSLRTRAMSIIQDRTRPLKERIREAETFFGEDKPESDAELLSQLDAMEVVNPEWTAIKADIRRNLTAVEDEIPEMLRMGGLHLENRLERFYTYLLFRYTIDICYHRDPKRVLRFIRRCSRILLLLLAEWCWKNQDSRVPVSVLEDRARIFSRQVEHSQENIDLLLRPAR